MERRLNEAMAAGGEDDGYFCRLSSRSPKDAVRLDDDGPADGESPLERMQRRNALLRVTKGTEVTALLRKSKRVFMDITNHFKCVSRACECVCPRACGCRFSSRVRRLV